MEGEYLGKLEDIMPTLESNSVRMIFADFPYGTTQCKWDSLVDLEVFWKEANRILVPNGVVICTAQFPFTATLAMSNMKNLRYEWIWEKTSATGHLNAKKMPMKAHENILVFYNKLPLYNPQKTQGHSRKVSKAEHKKNCKESEVYNKGQQMTSYDSTDRYPRDVLKIASDKQKSALHPTQKPQALLEYFIKTYSNEGDLVLDPCRGSNTTGVMCDKLGRRYKGIENDLEFYNIGLERRSNYER